MKKSILIRTDANSRIGAGHLMRCLALAEALRRRGLAPIFATFDSSPEFLRLIRSRGFTPRSVQASPAGLFKLGRRAVGVVVDRYGLPATYITSIKRARPGWVVLKIDDTGEASDGADIVLNQNLSASRAMYRALRSAVTLLGPRFALLRREIAAARPRALSLRARRVVLTLGGSRQRQVGPIAGALARALPDCRVVAIAPRAVLPDGGGPIDWRVPVKNFASVLRSADLAVTGAGTTILETARLGVPTLCLVIADNQRVSAAAAHRRGIVRSLGTIGALDPVRLSREARRMANSASDRRRMRSRQLACVDGSGAERVAAAFMKLVNRRQA